MKSSASRKPISPNQFRNFIFAGRAVFTLENKTTDNYITFKVKQMRKVNEPVPHMYVVECKALGDNNYGYTLLGFLNLQTRTFSSRVEQMGLSKDYIGFKTWVWLLRNLETLERFEALAIYHEGKCCKCGMPLTVPESITSGIGPECLKRTIHFSVEKIKAVNLWNDALDYETNLRNCIQTHPAMWSELYIPEGFKREEAFEVHRMFERMSIF